VETEELKELRSNINELEQLMGGGGAVSLVFEATTGSVSLMHEGSYLKIREVIQYRAEQDSKLAPSAKRALQLVEEIDAAMLKYTRTFGQFPPELYIH
jgi:hypothetical protein